MILVPKLLAVVPIASGIVLWIIIIQRKLVVLDEDISNALSQIGVYLSGSFDALTAILEVTKNYDQNESEILIKTIKHNRSIIIGKSKPDDVLFQEQIISDTLDKLAELTEKFPELKENQTYIKAMEAIQAFDNMVRTSTLMYNESVSRLNHKIQIFPVFVFAEMIHIRQRVCIIKQV